MTKIVGISGSPRRSGNTEILLDKALEGARSAGAFVEKIILNDMNFRPCQECGGCDKTGRCIIKDDMQLIYKKIETADGIIIASPIFFGSVSAQTKMMIDRFHCWWVNKYVLKNIGSEKKKQKGIFLCVSGVDMKEFFENARKLIRIFFATLDIEYLGDLFYGGVDSKDAIKEKTDALKKAFDAGAAYGKFI